jgi:hypothetical protein
MDNQGVIFYNYGIGCAARLAVAVWTLRKHYTGPLAIISDGQESHDVCRHFAADARLGVQLLECDFNVKKDKNHHYLSKCRLHDYTPYDVSLYIDADVVVRGDLTPMLAVAAEHEFAVPQFCDWKSSTPVIRRRLLDWRKIRPRDMRPALEYGPAINTGVFAFRRDSTFMADWFKIARRGRKFFIPDEVSCQLVLWRYPHKVVEHFYNGSCRFDDCLSPEIRLIHYHGRKHIREGMPFHGKVWIDTYQEVERENVADINSWKPAGDRRLAAYLLDPSSIEP